MRNGVNATFFSSIDALPARREEAMRDKITKRTLKVIGPSLDDTFVWDREIPGIWLQGYPNRRAHLHAAV